MKEELFENPVELRAAVPTPRFDDRRVVLRAQRVVPLEEIRTKLRLRRLWLLSGAFAVAIVLGAASALVAVQVKRLTVANQAPLLEETTTAATVEAQLLPIPVDSLVESAVIEETPSQPPVRRVVPAPKPQARLAERPRIVGGDRGGVEPSEDEQLEQIRDAVLYEQWQERRLRRAARRERRNRSGDRDLSHVDEIFEGPRRPERP